MSALALVASGNVDGRTPASSSHKIKTNGFAIAIIIGIIGLAIGATGLAGYLHVGALSHMSHVDAFIMMGGGGGCGVILLIIGIVGGIKSSRFSSQAISTTSYSRKAVASSHIEAALLPQMPKPMINIITSYFCGIEEGVYGAEAWRMRGNIDIVDEIPPPPAVDFSEKDKVLIYMPQRIRFNGEEQNLTLKVLKTISSDLFTTYFDEVVEERFGDSSAPGKWFLIDKNIIAESQEKNYETQQTMVKERGGSMPSVLEAVVLNLMVFAFTGERRYSPAPGEQFTYTRCFEKVNGLSSVVVGRFGFVLFVTVSDDVHNSCWFGTVCVQR